MYSIQIEACNVLRGFAVVFVWLLDLQLHMQSVSIANSNCELESR